MAEANPPPLGWDRLPGFDRRVVVATRNVRREGRDPTPGSGPSHRVSLGLRLDRDELDLWLERSMSPLSITGSEKGDFF